MRPFVDVEGAGGFGRGYASCVGEGVEVAFGVFAFDVAEVAELAAPPEREAVGFCLLAETRGESLFLDQ